MLLALMFPLVTSAPIPLVADSRLTDPPIKVWLNNDGIFDRGDRAKVKVQSAEDGYLVVFRATTEGRIRVLFPLDPGDDNFIRAGKTYEVKGRGDREAFTVDDGNGSGTVYAALATDPIRFDEYTRGDHWDYRVISASRVSDNGEVEFNELMDKMAGDGHYQYDFVTYQVRAQAAYADDDYYWRPYHHAYDPFYDPCFGCAPYYGSGVSISVGFGFGYPRYRNHYRPLFYDPYFYDPYFYDPFFYDPFPYYGYNRFAGCGYSSYCYGPGFSPGARSRSPYVFKGVPPLTPGYRPGYRPRTILAGSPGATPVSGVSPRPRGLSLDPAARSATGRQPAPRTATVPGDGRMGVDPVGGRRAADGEHPRVTQSPPTTAETPRRRGIVTDPPVSNQTPPSPNAEQPRRRGIQADPTPVHADPGSRPEPTREAPRPSDQPRERAAPPPRERDAGRQPEPRHDAPPPRNDPPRQVERPAPRPESRPAPSSRPSESSSSRRRSGTQ